FVAIAVVAALSATGTPLVAGAPRPAHAGQGPTGTIHGYALNAQGQPIPISLVRVRGLANAQLAGTTTTNTAGQFRLTDIPPGEYVVEIVSAAGKLLGTSAAVTVAPGAPISVTITVAAIEAPAAASAGGISTAAVVVSAAAAAGVVGGVGPK